jgi:predicted ATPase
LLIDSAKRTQLVVTTHSDALLSALTEHPSSILVCEHRNGTVFERLDPERLTFWLEAYRLGEVWRIGELGGNP